MQLPPLFLDLHVLMSPATVTKLLTILDYSVVSLVFNIIFFIVLKFLLVLVSSSKVLFIMDFLCFLCTSLAFLQRLLQAWHIYYTIGQPLLDSNFFLK